MSRVEVKYNTDKRVRSAIEEAFFTYLKNELKITYEPKDKLLISEIQVKDRRFAPSIERVHNEIPVGGLSVDLVPDYYLDSKSISEKAEIYDRQHILSAWHLPESIASFQYIGYGDDNKVLGSIESSVSVVISQRTDTSCKDEELNILFSQIVPFENQWHNRLTMNDTSLEREPLNGRMIFSSGLSDEEYLESLKERLSESLSSLDCTLLNIHQDNESIVTNEQTESYVAPITDIQKEYADCIEFIDKKIKSIKGEKLDITLELSPLWLLSKDSHMAFLKKISQNVISEATNDSLSASAITFFEVYSFLQTRGVFGVNDYKGLADLMDDYDVNVLTYLKAKESSLMGKESMEDKQTLKSYDLYIATAKQRLNHILPESNEDVLSGYALSRVEDNGIIELKKVNSSAEPIKGEAPYLLNVFDLEFRREYGLDSFINKEEYLAINSNSIEPDSQRSVMDIDEITDKSITDKINTLLLEYSDDEGKLPKECTNVAGIKDLMESSMEDIKQMSDVALLNELGNVNDSIVYFDNEYTVSQVSKTIYGCMLLSQAHTRNLVDKNYNFAGLVNNCTYGSCTPNIGVGLMYNYCANYYLGDETDIRDLLKEELSSIEYRLDHETDIAGHPLLSTPGAHERKASLMMRRHEIMDLLDIKHTWYDDMQVLKDKYNELIVMSGDSFQKEDIESEAERSSVVEEINERMQKINEYPDYKEYMIHYGLDKEGISTGDLSLTWKNSEIARCQSLYVQNKEIGMIFNSILDEEHFTFDMNFKSVAGDLSVKQQAAILINNNLMLDNGMIRDIDSTTSFLNIYHAVTASQKDGLKQTSLNEEQISPSASDIQTGFDEILHSLSYRRFIYKSHLYVTGSDMLNGNLPYKRYRIEDDENRPVTPLRYSFLKEENGIFHEDDGQSGGLIRNIYESFRVGELAMMEEEGFDRYKSIDSVGEILNLISVIKTRHYLGLDEKYDSNDLDSLKNEYRSCIRQFDDMLENSKSEKSICLELMGDKVRAEIDTLSEQSVSLISENSIDDKTALEIDTVLRQLNILKAELTWMSLDSYSNASLSLQIHSLLEEYDRTGERNGKIEAKTDRMLLSSKIKILSQEASLRTHDLDVFLTPERVVAYIRDGKNIIGQQLDLSNAAEVRENVDEKDGKFDISLIKEKVLDIDTLKTRLSSISLDWNLLEGCIESIEQERANSFSPEKFFRKGAEFAKELKGYDNEQHSLYHLVVESLIKNREISDSGSLFFSYGSAGVYYDLPYSVGDYRRADAVMFNPDMLEQGVERNEDYVNLRKTFIEQSKANNDIEDAYQKNYMAETGNNPYPALLLHDLRGDDSMIYVQYMNNVHPEGWANADFTDKLDKVADDIKESFNVLIPLLDRDYGDLYFTPSQIRYIDDRIDDVYQYAIDNMQEFSKKFIDNEPDLSLSMNFLSKKESDPVNAASIFLSTVVYGTDYNEENVMLESYKFTNSVRLMDSFKECRFTHSEAPRSWDNINHWLRSLDTIISEQTSKYYPLVEQSFTENGLSQWFDKNVPQINSELIAEKENRIENFNHLVGSLISKSNSSDVNSLAYMSRQADIHSFEMAGKLIENIRYLSLWERSLNTIIQEDYPRLLKEAGDIRNVGTIIESDKSSARLELSKKFIQGIHNVITRYPRMKFILANNDNSSFSDIYLRTLDDNIVRSDHKSDSKLDNVKTYIKKINGFAEENDDSDIEQKFYLEFMKAYNNVRNGQFILDVSQENLLMDDVRDMKPIGKAKLYYSQGDDVLQGYDWYQPYEYKDSGRIIGVVVNSDENGTLTRWDGFSRGTENCFEFIISDLEYSLIIHNERRLGHMNVNDRTLVNNQLLLNLYCDDLSEVFDKAELLEDYLTIRPSIYKSGFNLQGYDISGIEAGKSLHAVVNHLKRVIPDLRFDVPDTMTTEECSEYMQRIIGERITEEDDSSLMLLESLYPLTGKMCGFEEYESKIENPEFAKSFMAQFDSCLDNTLVYKISSTKLIDTNKINLIPSSVSQLKYCSYYVGDHSFYWSQEYHDEKSGRKIQVCLNSDDKGTLKVWNGEDKLDSPLSYISSVITPSEYELFSDSKVNEIRRMPIYAYDNNEDRYQLHCDRVDDFLADIKLIDNLSEDVVIADDEEKVNNSGNSSQNVEIVSEENKPKIESVDPISSNENQNPVENPINNQDNLSFEDSNIRISDFKKDEILNNNISAIETSLLIIREKRAGNPSPSEMKILERYLGFGGLKCVLYMDDDKSRWPDSMLPFYDKVGQLRSLIENNGLYPPEELKNSIKCSVTTAFYTDMSCVQGIIDGIGNSLTGHGLSIKTMLDPCSGDGRFAISAHTVFPSCNVMMVEQDTLSSSILLSKYGYEKVCASAFEKVRKQIPQYDVVGSNYPFLKAKVVDMDWISSHTADYVVHRESMSSVHNYFAIAGMDRTRDGGLNFFITTRGFADSPSNEIFRSYLMDKASLIAAVRLPDNLFASTSGVSVGSDLFILQKRMPTQEKSEYDRKVIEAFVKTESRIIDGREYCCNPIFNPQSSCDFGKCLGNHRLLVNQYGDYKDEYQFKGTREELKTALSRFIEQRMSESFVSSAYSGKVSSPTSFPSQFDLFGNDLAAGFNDERIFKYDQEELCKVIAKLKDGTLVSQGDEIGYFSMSLSEIGMFKPGDFDSNTSSVLRDYMQLRNAYKKLDHQERINHEEDAWLRVKLNQSYEHFVSTHGNLRDNASLILLDAYGQECLGLEYYEKGQSMRSDIFHEPIAFKKATTHQTDEAAFQTSMDRYGELHFDEMVQSVNGISRTEYEKDLGRFEVDAWNLYVRLNSMGLVYLNPNHITSNRESLLPSFYSMLESDTQFISGNVYMKKEEAEEALSSKLHELWKGEKRCDEYLQQARKSIDTLEKSKNKFVPFEDLRFNFGERWIPEKFFSDYLEYMTGATFDIRYIAVADDFDIYCSMYNTSLRVDYTVSYGNSQEYGYERMFTDALKDVHPQLFRTIHVNSEDIKVLDKNATIAVNQKINRIRDGFRDYLQTLPLNVKDSLAYMYNERFNCFVRPHYDGSYQTLPGMTLKGMPFDKLRDSQLDSTAMLKQNGGGLCAFCVGAGKTEVIICTAMEMRRLGKANKPMIVCMKANIDQIVETFRTIYPDARILSPRATDWEPKNRMAFMDRIRNNNWDAVILTNEQFAKIPQSLEVQHDLIKKEMGEIDAALDVLIETSRRGPSAKMKKGLEVRKKNLSANLEIILSKINNDKDKTITFEDMNIDHIIIDESHNFKNLMFSTRFTRVAGLGNTTGAQKTTNLLCAIRTIQKHTGRDLGATFLTGTPITNSLTELYSIFKYLRPNALERQKITCFDAWAAVYAEKTTKYEFGVVGDVKQKERFRYYKGVPELCSFYNEITDYRDAKMIGIERPEPNVKLEIIPQTKAEAEFAKRLLEFARTSDGKLIGRGELSDSEKKAHMLIATDLAVKSALDLKLVVPNTPDSPYSKASVVAKNIAEYYKKFNSVRGTQFVFCDKSTPSDKYNIYDAIKCKLVEDYKIPSQEIAFIQSAGSSKAKRAEMINGMNKGTVRVLFGSTQTLGTGVNAQKRAICVHHVDTPWRPSDLEQQNGRAVRTGNEVAKKYNDNKVDIIVYGKEKSVDVYKYELLEQKATPIRQINSGSVGSRVIEDAQLDEQTGMSYQELAANLSGNNDMMEKAKYEQELTKLEYEKKIFYDGQTQKERSISNLEGRIESKRKENAQIEQDYETFKECRRVVNIRINDKDEQIDISNPEGAVRAGKAINIWRRHIIGDDSLKIATMGENSEFALFVVKNANPLEGNLFNVVSRSQTYFGNFLPSSHERIGTFISDVLDGIPKIKAKNDTDIESMSNLLDGYKKSLNIEWDGQAQIDDLKNKITELDARISSTLATNDRVLYNDERFEIKVGEDNNRLITRADLKMFDVNQQIDLMPLQELLSSIDQDLRSIDKSDMTDLFKGLTIHIEDSSISLHKDKGSYTLVYESEYKMRQWKSVIIEKEQTSKGVKSKNAHLVQDDDKQME